MKWKHQKLEGCLGRFIFFYSGLSNNFPAFLCQCHKIKIPQKADWEHTTTVYEGHYTDQDIIVPWAVCLGEMREISTVQSKEAEFIQLLIKYALYKWGSSIFRGNNVLDGKLFHCGTFKCRFLPVSEGPFGGRAREEQRIWSSINQLLRSDWFWSLIPVLKGERASSELKNRENGKG